MIKGLLNILSRGASRRSNIQEVTQFAPLRLFNDAEYFRQFKLFRIIAYAISKHTNLMVESLLSDGTTNWKEAGKYATSEQVADLCIFCSHILIQFTFYGLEDPLVLVHFDVGLRADLSDLVRLMYGDFCAGSASDGLSFARSVESRDLNDSQEALYLTRLLDQLIGVDQGPNQRGAKVKQVRELFSEHRRAFTYTLHSALNHQCAKKTDRTAPHNRD